MDIANIATARAGAATESITNLRILAAGLEDADQKERAENALNDALRSVEEIATGVADVVSGDRKAAKAAAKHAEEAEEKLAEGAKIVVEGALPGSETLQAVSTATAAVRATATAVEATASEGKTAGDLRIRIAKVMFVLLVIFGGAYWLLWINVLDSPETRGAAAITLAALAVGLTVLFWVGKGSFRLYLVGADGRFSTSKVQVAMWTLIVVTMVGYLSLLLALLTTTDAESLGLT